jgi:Undecaprenyl-phosphate glucose phosphotransferase
VLKKRRQFFASLLLLFDLGMLSGAWLAAYELRESGWPVPLYLGMPPLQDYLFLLIVVLPIWGVVFTSLKMYHPRRTGGHLGAARDLLQASTLATFVLLVTAYFLKKFEVSRLVFVYFWGMGGIGLLLTRLTFRAFLRLAYRRGYNLRHSVILGTEELGRELHQRLAQHPELGCNLVGFLTTKAHEVGRYLDGVEVLGHIDDVRTIVQARTIDQVYIALPLEAILALEKILQQLGTEMVDITIVPDLYRYIILQGSVEEFEGLPVITLSSSPMYGWNSVLKRAFDLCVSAPLLLVCLPFLGLMALLVKLTSHGPVFYLQERMGLGGKAFRMVKFRTMYVDAERHTGAVWTQEWDPRCTPLGALLRRTSLDELPQLWNVLKGEMSLVGPRPERPVFVEEFRQRIPRYMLRHRVKAGMTGWAQVQGWRGNTSLEKRLEHDLYYVQHWSLLLDVKILWLTLWRGFVHRNAY